MVSLMLRDTNLCLASAVPSAQRAQGPAPSTEPTRGRAELPPATCCGARSQTSALSLFPHILTAWFVFFLFKNKKKKRKKKKAFWYVASCSLSLGATRIGLGPSSAFQVFSPGSSPAEPHLLLVFLALVAQSLVLI